MMQKFDAQIGLMALKKPRGGLRPTVITCPVCGEYGLAHQSKNIWECPKGHVLTTKQAGQMFEDLLK